MTDYEYDPNNNDDINDLLEQYKKQQEEEKESDKLVESLIEPSESIPEEAATLPQTQKVAISKKITKQPEQPRRLSDFEQTLMRYQDLLNKPDQKLQDLQQQQQDSM